MDRTVMIHMYPLNEVTLVAKVEVQGTTYG